MTASDSHTSPVAGVAVVATMMAVVAGSPCLAVVVAMVAVVAAIAIVASLPGLVVAASLELSLLFQIKNAFLIIAISGIQSVKIKLSFG